MYTHQKIFMYKEVIYSWHYRRENIFVGKTILDHLYNNIKPFVSLASKNGFQIPKYLFERKSGNKESI